MITLRLRACRVSWLSHLLFVAVAVALPIRVPLFVLVPVAARAVVVP